MYANVEIFALIITSIIIISGDWSWNRPNARHKYFAFVKQISPCKKKKQTGHFPFYILILWSLFTAGTAFLRIARWVRGTHTPKKMTKHIHITAYGFHFQLYATIHNDHSDHLFLFVEKHKTKTENLFHRIMISKKLTHTHTAQQDRSKLGSRVVYKQRVVYGTKP